MRGRLALVMGFARMKPDTKRLLLAVGLAEDFILRREGKRYGAAEETGGRLCAACA